MFGMGLTDRSGLTIQVVGALPPGKQMAFRAGWFKFNPSFFRLVRRVMTHDPLFTLRNPNNNSKLSGEVLPVWAKCSGALLRCRTHAICSFGGSFPQTQPPKQGAL